MSLHRVEQVMFVVTGSSQREDGRWIYEGLLKLDGQSVPTTAISSNTPDPDFDYRPAGVGTEHPAGRYLGRTRVWIHEEKDWEDCGGTP